MSHLPKMEIIEFEEKYAPSTVRMWRASMERALGVEDSHTWQEQLNYLKLLTQKYRVFIAVVKTTDQVVGLMVTGGTELDQLYIHVDYQGMGLGTRLLNLAKSLSPGKLQLYTFEVNQKAQRFYEGHGFKIIGRGVESQSGMADIRYEWTQEQPNTGHA